MIAPSTLVWGPPTVALGFLVHILWWRLAPPRRHTLSLLGLFFGAFVAAGTLARLLPVEALGSLPTPRSLPQLAHLGLFVLANTLGYVITYSAVEADSPSLVLILAARDQGGLTPEALEEFKDDQVLVLDRVDDLVRDKMATEEDGRLRATAKGLRFVALIAGFRDLLGAEKGG